MPLVTHFWPPRMPAGWQICMLCQRWVEVEDLRQAHNRRIFHLRVLQAKELPNVIVAIVADVQDRHRSIGDLPKGDDEAIRRLVKKPFAHRDTMVHCGDRAYFTGFSKTPPNCNRLPLIGPSE